VSDRRLWLDEVCPDCRAAPGLRCQTDSYTRKAKPLSSLHAARGWRQRRCPTCKAPPGEACHTPTGRSSTRPHTARLPYGRREPTVDAVWDELEQWGARIAIVRFHGGAGKPGVIDAVTLEDAGERELSRWSSGEGPLPDELAAPVWARYAAFRGHPRIVGMVFWDVNNREVFSSGMRGETPFTDVPIARRPTRAPLPWRNDTSRDTSRRQRNRCRHPPHRMYAPANAAGQRSPPTPATRPSTAQSSAAKPRPVLVCGRPPGAPGSAPPSGAHDAPARCPMDCDPRRATAPSAAARPPPARVSLARPSPAEQRVAHPSGSLSSQWGARPPSQRRVSGPRGLVSRPIDRCDDVADGTARPPPCPHEVARDDSCEVDVVPASLEEPQQTGWRRTRDHNPGEASGGDLPSHTVKTRSPTPAKRWDCDFGVRRSKPAALRRAWTWPVNGDWGQLVLRIAVAA
jgi:hypothetical protein